MKNKKQLIFDYISGKDIERVEALENDESFMKTVIQLTKDPKMFRYCSKKLQHNPDFALSLIKEFERDNKSLLCLAEQFPKEFEDEMEEMEFTVLYSKIYKKTRSSDLEFYQIAATAYLNRELIELAGAKDESCKLGLEDVNGECFFLTKEAYDGHPILMDFVAEGLLEQILHEQDGYSMEELVHLAARNVNTIEQLGDATFLINYIAGYDQLLAGYLHSNPELLEEEKRNLERIRKNWTSYSNRINRDRVEAVVEEALRYGEERRLLVEELHGILKDTIEKLHLTKIFEKHGIDKLLGIEPDPDDEWFKNDDDLEKFIKAIEDDKDSSEDFMWNADERKESDDPNVVLLDSQAYQLHMENYIKKVFSKDVLVDKVMSEEELSVDTPKKGK